MVIFLCTLLLLLLCFPRLYPQKKRFCPNSQIKEIAKEFIHRNNDNQKFIKFLFRRSTQTYLSVSSSSVPHTNYRLLYSRHTKICVNKIMK